MQHTYVAIMAGGIGSRFWPKSRAAYPKQFIDILNTGKTLIQATYDRFAKLVGPERIYVVTNARYADIVAAQLPELDPDQILREPSRKNTAPCAAYVSFKVQARDPKANIIVTPSDHLIFKDEIFEATVHRASDFVKRENALVTLGIEPTRPDTGYGYIQYFDDAVADGVYKVKTFTEKPTVEIAQRFIDSGDFLWNSGMFFWNVDTIASAFEQHLPEIHEAFQSGISAMNTAGEAAYIEQAYSLCHNISIDYGIMEKSENVFVIPSSFGWSDVGTWKSLYEMYEKDEAENAVKGAEVRAGDGRKNMIMAPDGKLVVIEGLEDFCVIDTEDVLLICPKSREQEIKAITGDLKREKLDRYL